MARDPISEVLHLVDARCVITGGLHAGGQWSHRSQPDTAVKIDAVVSGSCWLIADYQAPVRLGSGDAAVLCGVDTAVLCSDPNLTPDVGQEPPQKLGLFSRIGTGEPDVVIIGGHVDLDPTSADLFTSALPLVLHAPAKDAEAAEMRRLLERIVDESESDRAGARFAADQYAQLLLLEALRTVMRHHAAVPPGWLRLLMDSRLRPAVSLMHADPGRAWQLPELAAAAKMSRSHFARQFKHVSGQPPLMYLSHWRIQLAQRALRTSDVTVASLAQRLGFASESTFSHAFARVAGTSPSRYRRSVGI
ncbi:AraC family transcriptional regulator [Streptomyces sp. NPDC004752]